MKRYDVASDWFCRDMRSHDHAAQAYFHVFNPVMRSRRFDGDGRFTRMYLPELARMNSDFIHEPCKVSIEEQTAAAVSIGLHYPYPIVDHEAVRR